MRHFNLLCALIPLLTISACTPTLPDYSLFEKHKPRTILVIPPLNETASIDAPYKYFPTATLPLAERGYYVIPVAVADRLLKENGVIGPEEMRQVSRSKLREIFGADALFDVTIKTWGTSYLIFASSTTVELSYRLIDLHSGEELWSATDRLSDSSNGGNEGLAEALAGALIHAVANAKSDTEVALAENLNNSVLLDRQTGLLPGARWVEEPKN